MTRTLVVRLDSVGDVLLAGPAIAAAASDGPVDVLCSPIGRPAAALLPGVDHLIELSAPWILHPAPPVDRAALAELIETLSAAEYDRAAILTSSHQSSLPMALLLRFAGINRIAAVSNDYPGSLLDHRIPGDPDLHEVERALAVVAALGVEVGHPSALRLRVEVTAAPAVRGRVAVHPGAAAPARTLPVSRWTEVTASLARCGFDVVVTGTQAEAGSCAAVAAPTGRPPVIVPTDDLRRLARELARASVVVAGNTGPTHLAAALGRPVVTVFAPTVPPDRWKPWGVPHVLLGDLDIACAGCRSRICPLPGQPCTAGVTAPVVCDAVAALAAFTHDERLEAV